MNNVTIGITGIINPQMKTALKNSLDKIEGVQSVDVDRTLKEIEVGFNSPANETVIRDCIKKTGFNLI